MPAWTANEDKLVKSIWPDRDRLQELLPKRSGLAIRRRATMLGKRKPYKLITTEQGSVIRRLWPNIDHIRAQIPELTRRSIRGYAFQTLRLPRVSGRSNRPYSTEEIEKIKRGAQSLPNRTGNGVNYKRLSLGIKLEGSVQPWTAAEIAALKIAPYDPLPSRTISALHSARWKLRLTRSRPVAHHGSAGETLLSTISRSIPSSLPRQIQREVLSDLTLAVLEGEIELAGVAGAVSKAIKGVYKRYPVLGAPVSLDIPLFDDGEATLGDRITSDAFHF